MRPWVAIATILPALAGCGGGATLSIGGTTVEVGLDASLELPDRGVSVSFEGPRSQACNGQQPCPPDAPGVFLTLRKDGAAASRVALGAGETTQYQGVRLTYLGAGTDAGRALLAIGTTD